MSLKVFAELVELKAKTASVFPFVLGMAYSWFHYRQVHLGKMLFFFVAMFLFNMAVDILDNYMDYHNATDLHDYKEETNIIGREGLSLSLVRNIMISFIVISASMGIYLASQTSWVVLWLGIISYSVGIFYSAGPKPLSSLPVGEVASGLAMGYVIPLICVYLNVYDVQAFTWSFAGAVFVMALPAVFAIANLMLANNTCDLEEDLLNNRRTLVAYIGKPAAINLFWFLAITPFVVATLAVFTKLIPWTVLGIWLIFPIIWKNTSQFARRQNKLTTFPLAIKNLALTVMLYAVLFVIGAVL
ncbi:prenyltransferase [Vagococcus salmoninarum]|uniref:1,4-dihydroxy-2-naphthoate polyprenyltransferase n=1 Tax=Vagococcus salmoninarum TaxID=2739 RepID=A0A429ZCC4_9ENTE|nr:prenyltransferase [Vagococcus salmoninarum]MBE9390200.1 prenyltransferase [Vagococcus salmoninarum]RST91333.1 1,4-dihydroxy-2-naphthoate polyprenyltransferase [Vagococcus salmoninarum]